MGIHMDGARHQLCDIFLSFSGTWLNDWAGLHMFFGLSRRPGTPGSCPIAGRDEIGSRGFFGYAELGIARWRNGFVREPVWCFCREIEARFENSAASGLLPATSQDADVAFLVKPRGARRKDVPGSQLGGTKSKSMKNSKSGKKMHLTGGSFLNHSGMAYPASILFGTGVCAIDTIERRTAKASAVPFFSS